MLILAGGLTILAMTPSDLPLWHIVIGLAVSGLGMAAFSSPNTSAVMGAVERDRLGVAAAVLAMMRTLGQTLSLAILGTLAAAPLGAAGAGVLFGATEGLGHASAYLDGYRMAMGVGAAIAVVGACLSLSRGPVVVPPPRPGRRSGAPRAQVGGPARRPRRGERASATRASTACCTGWAAAARATAGPCSGAWVGRPGGDRVAGRRLRRPLQQLVLDPRHADPAAPPTSCSHEFPDSAGATATVVIRADEGTLTGRRRAGARRRGSSRRARTLPDVVSVSDPFALGSLAPDGRTAMVTVTYARPVGDLGAPVAERLEDALRRRRRRRPARGLHRHADRVHPVGRQRPLRGASASSPPS